MHSANSRQTLWDCLGWCGAALLLSAYTLFSLSMLEAKLEFHLLNLLGAMAVGKAAWTRRSYPAAFVEFAWASIAMIALLRFCMLET